MKSVYITLFALFLVFTCPAANAQENTAQDFPGLEEVTLRGRMLHAYDQAAWHGTDAVRPLMQDVQNLGELISGYVVKHENNHFHVGFGRLSEDKSEFITVFEAYLDNQYSVMEVFKHEEPVYSTCFYHDAMMARQAVLEGFDPPEQVAYNTAVIPGPGDSIYVFMMPAQPAINVYYLGADFRYTFDTTSATITDTTRLHNSMQTIDLRSQAPLTMSTAILTDIPTETDVFFAISRPPSPRGQPNHLVIVEDGVFLIDQRGNISYMDRSEINQGQPEIDSNQP